MRGVLVILFVVSSTTGFPHTNRVWGGQNATSGQFPFAVAMNNYQQWCSGVIIAPNWILTAAQCLFYLSPPASIYVGSHINEVNGTAYKITDTVIHEGFNASRARNDIGLIRLETDLTFSDTIQAIEFSEAIEPNMTCTVVGFGSTENESFPSNLQYLELTVIDMDLCQNISAGQLDDDYLGPEQICTLSPEGQGACYGDAGAPLVCNGQLAGIFSYSVGYNCGAQTPGVYTSIFTYLNWILAVIQP